MSPVIVLLLFNFLLVSESKRVCKGCVNSKPHFEQTPKIASRRLYFGQIATVNQFSSMVFVGTVDEGFRQICGGTLISLTAVLTAAHCLVKEKTSRKLRDEIIVYAGEICMNDFEDASNPNITKVIIHPRYDRLKSKNSDIAIIRLSATLEASDAIQPAQLPVKHAEANQIITLPGWGYTEWGQLSNELRFIYMVIVKSPECHEILHKNNVHAGLCAIEDKKMPCVGDSGGPWFIMDTNIIVGLTSFGFAIKGSKNCTPNRPVMGTNVMHHIKWITHTAFFD